MCSYPARPLLKAFFCDRDCTPEHCSSAGSVLLQVAPKAGRVWLGRASRDQGQRRFGSRHIPGQSSSQKAPCLVHGKDPVCPEAAWGLPWAITPRDRGTLQCHQLIFHPSEGGKGISEGLSEGWKAVSTQWLGKVLGE